MPALVHNERVKYGATWLNTASLGFLVVGVITPLERMLSGSGEVRFATLLISAGWLLGSFILHMAVRVTLGRLRE